MQSSCVSSLVFAWLCITDNDRKIHHKTLPLLFLLQVQQQQIGHVCCELLSGTMYLHVIATNDTGQGKVCTLVFKCGCNLCLGRIWQAWFNKFLVALSYFCTTLPEISAFRLGLENFNEFSKITCLVLSNCVENFEDSYIHTHTWWIVIPSGLSPLQHKYCCGKSAHPLLLLFTCKL